MMRSIFWSVTALRALIALPAMIMDGFFGTEDM